MTPTEGFAFGFLLHCADAGLSPAQADERVKIATLIADVQAGRVTEKTAGWASTAAWLGALAPVVPPVVAYGLGSATGRARADMAQNAGLDAQSLKQKELLAELDKQIAMLETAAASRHRRMGNRPGIRAPQMISTTARRV